ncbi:MAG: hypothetical protein WBF87_04325 [Mesorhizobium sp.]
MIQYILLFALGFLSALFLALLVAPAIWRRAEALTRKRIEASVPLTMNEIQADKDRMRADFAMSSRRLEMSAASSREKATVQTIELSRVQDEVRRLEREAGEGDAARSALDATIAGLRDDLKKRDEMLAQAGERQGQLDRVIDDLNGEIEKLGRMYDEATLTASSRQIELVARETEMERLSHDAGVLRGQKKDAESRANSVGVEARAAEDVLREERKRAAGLERKVERLTASLADLEAKLDLQGGGKTEARNGKARGPEAGAEASDQNAVLREQIQQLAAQVVNMTAALDGPSSTIDKLLAERATGTVPDGQLPLSLADRIRALRQAASERG